MNRSDYKKLRDRFKPKKIKTIFILESPPASGLYFYNPDGRISEQLFSALTKCTLNYPASTKKEGLKKFASEGYFLIDATYKPVDKIKSKNNRDKEIIKAFPNLVLDLKKIVGIKKINLILVKSNICKLLEPRLTKSGFKVINKGEVIPFPSTGWQKEFSKKIKKFISKNN